MLLLLLMALPLRAQQADGYLELRAHAYAGVEGDFLEFVELLRPGFSARLGKRLVLASTVELDLHQGRSLQQEIQRSFEESDLGPLMDLAGCTWPQEGNEFLGISQVSDYLSVERLTLDAYTPHVDLRLGRQAIFWGSAFMVNPTDPFPEVLLLEPWKPRTGVNALRSTIPMGKRHQFQAVLGSDDTFQKLRVAGRATIGFGLADLSLVGAWRQEAQSAIAGVDLRGTLGVGYWFEGALHLDTSASTQDHQAPYEELAVGLDYSLPLMDGLVITAQYYRNGAGAVEYDPQSLVSNLGGVVEMPDCGDVDLLSIDQESDTDPFAPFFSGRDYAMLSLMLAINPDLSFTGLWVQNLGDGSAMAVPVLTTYPSSWLQLSAAAQLPFSLWGAGGELHPSDDDLLISFDTGTTSLAVDMSGLLPSATIIFWSRFNF